MRSPRAPRPQAYPSLVAADLGLTMTVREHQLPPDRRPARHQRCGGRRRRQHHPRRAMPRPAPAGPEPGRRDRGDRPGRSARPAWFSSRTAPTTSTSAPASSTSWPASSGSASGSGTACVTNGSVTPQIAADLANVRTSLAHAIETLAPHAPTVAVLDYYQPIPEPSQIAKGTATSGSAHEPGLQPASSPMPASTFAAAQVVLPALEQGRRRRRGATPALTTSRT